MKYTVCIILFCSFIFAGCSNSETDSKYNFSPVTALNSVDQDILKKTHDYYQGLSGLEVEYDLERIIYMPVSSSFIGRLATLKFASEFKIIRKSIQFHHKNEDTSFVRVLDYTDQTEYTDPFVAQNLDELSKHVVTLFDLPLIKRSKINEPVKISLIKFTDSNAFYWEDENIQHRVHETSRYGGLLKIPTTSGNDLFLIDQIFGAKYNNIDQYYKMLKPVSRQSLKGRNCIVFEGDLPVVDEGTAYRQRVWIDENTNEIIRNESMVYVLPGGFFYSRSTIK